MKNAQALRKRAPADHSGMSTRGSDTPCNRLDAPSQAHRFQRCRRSSDLGSGVDAILKVATSRHQDVKILGVVLKVSRVDHRQVVALQLGARFAARDQCEVSIDGGVVVDWDRAVVPGGKEF